MAININQDIGKNGFKLKHLIWSNTAKNNGINNMPGIDDSPSTDEIIKNLNDLANNVIDPILEIYPNLFITSGYRCVELNKILGGSNTSQHIFGQAVDLKVPQLTTADLYNWIYSNITSYDQLIWEYPEKGDGSWVHVSFSSQNRKKTTLASSREEYHNLYNGTRYGSYNQYQHDITEAKLV